MSSLIAKMPRFEEGTVISDLNGLKALESAWNELWVKAKGTYSQGYNLCLHTWNDIAKGEKNLLFCIAIWEGERLVMVLPLIKQNRTACRVIKPLGPCGAETSDILIDPDANLERCAVLAWELLTETCGCDVVHIPFVKVGSGLDSAIPKGSETMIDHNAAPYAELRDQKDWDSYCKLVGSSSWQQAKRKKKRISELGELDIATIDPVKEPARSAELIGWMLEQKQQWGKRTHKEGSWLYSPEYRAFLIHNITDPANAQQCVIYALLVNGAPIAVKLVAIGAEHVDYVIGGYHTDPQYAKYSPGLILDEYWIKVAFEGRRNVDFGAGEEPYKLLWSRGNKHALVTYRVPLTVRGRATLVAWKLWNRFRRGNGS